MPTMMKTDPLTIESIQSTAPALSKSDFNLIQEHMRSGEFFAGVTDPSMRAKITQRLLASKELVPSLYTLISDIRYLKQPAKLLSALLPPKTKRRTKRIKGTKATTGTLRQRFHFHFTGTGSSDHAIQIQQEVFSYINIQDNDCSPFELSYQQLWLCSYRVWKYPNAYSILQLATLAQRLGFSSPQIERETAKDPGQAVVEKAVQEVLHTLRPNEKFNFDADQARPLLESFNNYLKIVLIVPSTPAPPYITAEGQGEPLTRRRGHSCMDTKDLNNLFLDKIHSGLQDYQMGGDEISSFYVKRSRHIAFFGALNLANSRREQADPLPSFDVVLEQPPNTRTGEHTVGSGSPNVEALVPHQDSSHHIQDQNLQFTGQVITFIVDNIPSQRVPYEKDLVNNQAREYADKGKKLRVSEGPHFTWQDCFDILTRTRSSTVLVSTMFDSMTGKRRRDQELPDKFQAATKEAFDFRMTESDEEL